jgi:hypothetical protein
MRKAPMHPLIPMSKFLGFFYCISIIYLQLFNYNYIKYLNLKDINDC